MKLAQIKFTCLLTVIPFIFTASNIMFSGKAYSGLVYSPPLGYISSSSYGSYPSTKFGYQNFDLPNIDTCFTDDSGVPIQWPQLFHAGTDWFELSGASAAGDSVTAIADGVVEWISNSGKNVGYPGEVVIIKHQDPDLGTLYSL